MAKVLVVGGAGYVGGATVAWLSSRGHRVTVLDDLSTGYREFAVGERFVQAQAGDSEALNALLESEAFDCVMHFAALSLVEESITRREAYFENNVDQTQRLIDALLLRGVRSFVFSSSASVYGTSSEGSIEKLTETAPIHPVSPYGETKAKAEALIAHAAHTRGLKAYALRYFNAAGALPGAMLGERHFPETHLIPNILRAARAGRPVQINGADYGTPDGTCVRDYIHVQDLAIAHEAAMLKLLDEGGNQPSTQGFFEALNLGSESGSSILQVVSAAERVLGRPIARTMAGRRSGDPAYLVADCSRARRVLGFVPKYQGERGLEEIIRTAMEWDQKDRALKPAVFLDRDGTINRDPGYLSKAEQMNLLPGVGEALKKFRAAGFKIVVVSNQSGVGRGLIQPQEMPRINGRLAELLEKEGASIDHFELCYHLPEQDCACRKPRPLLIQNAAGRLSLDPARSFMVGDKVSDLGAGRAARVQAVALVRTGEGAREEAKLKPGDADFVGNDLLSVSEWIVNRRVGTA